MPNIFRYFSSENENVSTLRYLVLIIIESLVWADVKCEAPQQANIQGVKVEEVIHIIQTNKKRLVFISAKLGCI